MLQKVRLHKVLVINANNLIKAILLLGRVKIWKENLSRISFARNRIFLYKDIINLCTYARQKWPLQQDFREPLASWSIQYRTPLFSDHLVAMATVTIQLVS